MTTTGTLLLHALLGTALATGQTPLPQDAPERLYGSVVTSTGDVFEGFLRWDSNEGSWTDILHGMREMPEEYLEQARELGGEEYRRPERSVRVLGIRIRWDDEGSTWPDRAEAGIRFGHLRSLEVLDDDRALLVLKSGEEVVMHGGSTDIGRGNRGIVVDDPGRGQVVLEWEDLERVDFRSAPVPLPDHIGRRLYGTLRTRSGDEFTGAVAWDLDEILTSDVLDGDDRGRERKIRFSNIRAIERDGRSGARVVLANGEEVRLTGSNDVNDDNRGIVVTDIALGQVRVGWDEFSDLTFHEPATPAGYDRFDGGRALRGTVETRDGDRHTGFIRWDNDEASTWEILDGAYRGVDFDIELGRVAEIERISSGGARVTLLDGRVFELRDSNDVDRDNKGIFVETVDGDMVMLRWEDFRRAVFDSR